MSELPAKSSAWSHPMAKGLLVGRGKRGIVWMPSIHDMRKRYRFRPQQLLLLNAIAEGQPFEEACAKLQLTPEEGISFLKQKKCRDYLAEAASVDAEVVARGAKGRVLREILDVWDGKVLKTREQMEAGKEWWARVAPKPGIGNAASGEKIEITINVGKIKEAFARQDALDADVLIEKGAA